MVATSRDNPAVPVRALRSVTDLVTPKQPKPSSGRGKRLFATVPAVAVISLLGCGLLLLAWRSFHTYDTYLAQQGDLSLTQYRSLFFGGSSALYIRVLLRTTILSLLATLTVLALAIPVTYLIVRTPSSGVRQVVLCLCLVPFLMGDVVRAFGWLLVLGKHGAYGWMTSVFGLGNGSLVGTNLGIWIGCVQTVVPIAALVLLPAVRRIEPDLERAAGTLGARPWQVWWRVTLPLMRPGLAAAGAVSLALTMTQYAVPGMIGSGLLPFAANTIQNIFFSRGNIYLGSALALVVLTLVLLGSGLILLVLLPGGRRRKERKV